jgi:hypothetical protein
MPAVCASQITNLNHTKYIRIQDSILNGLCGSFCCFPDVNARSQLFQNPTGVGGCSTDFFRGIFFGGSDGTVFVPDFLSVPVFITSVTPTHTNHAGDLALGFNAFDGAVVLFLASLIIETGFITLQVRGVDEICEAFSQLPEGGGAFATMASATCAQESSIPGSPDINCTCPLFVNVTNGLPDQPKFRIVNPLAIGNTSSVTGFTFFAEITDADNNCFNALDAAAIVGGDALCTTAGNCPDSKLGDIHGIIELVSFAIDGLACVTLC